MLATPSDRYLFGTIPWYSALIVLGICAALVLATREEKRLSLPQDTVVDLALWVIPFGVIGARLYYVLFAWDTFSAHPISILYVWQGGLAIYGGVFGGLLAVFLYSRKRKLPLGLLTDIIVPGLALAQSIGRWGNYFNMEAYGLQITDPAWQFFPFAVFIPGHNGGTWHMATFFYESILNLIVFFALMFLRNRKQRSGDVTLWYMLLYGSGRLIIEGLRTDSLTAVEGTFRVSQLLSFILCLAVLFLFIWRATCTLPRKRLFGGLCAFFIVFVIFMITPQAAHTFTGYRMIWLLQLLLLLFAIFALPFSARTFINGILVIVSVVINAAAAQSGWRGIEASTLLCAIFSITSILTGMSIYSSIPNH